jgi:hypothetical protein
VACWSQQWRAALKQSVTVQQWRAGLNSGVPPSYKVSLFSKAFFIVTTDDKDGV